MNKKSYTVLMDIKKGVLNRQSIEFTTDDYGQCKLMFELKEDTLNAYNLTNCIVRMVTSNKQQQDCEIVNASEGKVEITLLQSMFSDAGFITAELQIYDSKNQVFRLTTPQFRYHVKRSLMNDETVQADPSYSILQNMIIEVSGANELANKAKTTAENALTKANQAVTTIKNEIGKVNKAVSDANAALDRAGDVATQEELDNKFLVGGKSQEIFNFIENQVEQEGLIYTLNRKVINSKENILTNKKILQNGTINISFSTTSANGSFEIISQILSARLKGWSLRYMESNGRNLYLVVGDGATKVVTSTKKLEPGVNYEIVLIFKDGNISLFVDNQFIINAKYITEENANIVISKLQTVDTYDKYFSISSLIYEGVTLSPQEALRNFSILNNSPALKSTEITDAEGNKSTLLFSSDGDHVEMRTGRTLEEEYMGVLSTMGKEFVADAQGKISVDNGVKARLISAEIQGQTVKNELISISSTNTPWTIDGAKYIYGGGTYSSIRGITFNANLVIGKEYTIVAHITQNTIATTGTNIFFIGDSTNLGSVNFIPTNSSGLIKKKITPSTTNGLLRMGIDASVVTAGTLIIEGLTILEGDWTNKQAPCTISTGLGLSSMQAVISNNNQSYEIYEPQIVGETRILDTNGNEVPAGTAGARLVSLKPTDDTLPPLGNTPSVSDTIDLATGVLSLNTKEFVLDGSDDEEWKAIGTNRFIITINDLVGITGKIEIINNRLQTIDWTSLIKSDGNNAISAISGYIGIGTGYATTLQELRSKLQANPITVRYRLAKPIKHQLTQGQVKAYDKYRKLILLRGIDGKNDKLEIREDGSQLLSPQVLRYQMTGDEPMSVYDTMVTNNFGVLVTLETVAAASLAKYGACNTLPVVSGTEVTLNDEKGWFIRSNKNQYFKIPRKELAEESIEGVRKWFKDNPTILEFIPSNPIAPIFIDKRANQPIPIHDKINILSAGDAVKASSFKATVPVDKLAELEARLQALESTTVDVVLNKQ